MSDKKYPVLESSLSSEQLDVLGKLERKNNCFNFLNEESLTTSELKTLEDLSLIREGDISKWTKYSRKCFSELKTFDDLLLFGVGIIENKFMSPWYNARFCDVEVSDNSDVTPKYVSEFADINRFGILTTNSQSHSGSFDNFNDTYQRAYVSGICRKSLAEYICAKLNRIPGIFSFYFENNRTPPPNMVQALWVTYDGKDTISRMTNIDTTVESIKKWNIALAKTISSDPDIVSIGIVDTMERNTLFGVVRDQLVMYSKVI